MEKVVKSYRTRLMVAAAMTGVLLFIFLERITGIVAIVLLPLLAYLYVSMRSKNAAFVGRLSSPNYGRDKKKAGVRIITFLATIVFGALIWVSWPPFSKPGVTTYTLIVLTILSGVAFVCSVLK